MKPNSLLYDSAYRLAESGQLNQAEQSLGSLLTNPDADKERLHNDLAVIQACRNQFQHAEESLKQATQRCPESVLYSENLKTIQSYTDGHNEPVSPPLPVRETSSHKVAILSLLFNWPSTGGGTVHTAELAKFLSKAGYNVKHFCASYRPWGVGQITEEPPSPAIILEFDDASWNAKAIQLRFRNAVDEFDPDFCIVTSSWNFKPLLAEAIERYPYILRYAALENICPLNNVRLLPDGRGGAIGCTNTQLASPHVCQQCVSSNEHVSGPLHKAERALSGYGTNEYNERLRRVVANAEAVFVVNPLIAALFGPYAKQVRVVPSGFDTDRFPTPGLKSPTRNDQKCRILFAGLTQEYMKGFHVLKDAAEQLWLQRQDFEIVITADAPSNPDPWSSYVGWQSQQQLPELMRSCDFLVFPTIAEEALGRSAVEAMACGLPVIASRIGGLQFVVSDHGNGLLFEPGNSEDLVRKMNHLIDSPERCTAMGRVGRKRFEQEFPWSVIIERNYVPVIGSPTISMSQTT